MNRKTFVVIVLLAAFFVSADSRLLAQSETAGAVAGTVTDPSNAAVPGATITLDSPAKGTSQTTTSGAAGTYRFDLLAPGDYTLQAKATGFETLNQKVTVVVGQVTAIDLRLVLGSQTQSVTVTAEAIPLINAENGNVTATISESQAQNIPNPGNDLTYMAQIAPGSVMNTGGGGLGNFSSYGVSAVSNLFTMNGMDTNDPFLNVNDSGATNLLLGQNEVQEVSVVTNGYSGEYGGLAGANVNYITRSGTNDFHGRATWYWNGRSMNANDWFFNNSTPKTPRGFVNANQYGADFGGPIVKNKLFFYVNAEGLYLVIPTSSTVFVPSPQFENAVTANIAKHFPGNADIQSFYSTMFKLYNTAPGVGRAVPRGAAADFGCDGSEGAFNSQGYTFGAPGKGNPLGAGTPCGLTYQSNVGNTTHENLQAYRVDYNVTNNDRVFFRYQHDKGIQASYTDPINALFNIRSTQPEDQGQLQETHTFGGGAVNQLIVSGQWYSAIFGNADQAATLAAFPTDVIWGGGQFNFVGGINFNFPQGRNVTQLQISDDFTKVHGNHTFKAGLKFRRNWITNKDYGIFTGGQMVPITLDAFFWGGSDVTVPAGPGGPNFSLLTQSFPTSLSQRFAVYTFGGYFEDDWKVKPNLTLTLAFRLDHPSNPVCFNNCFALATAEFPNLSTLPTTPYNQLINTGHHQMLPAFQVLLPQPRFGFAWTPGLVHNTVVRGGFGIFYDNYPGALLDGLSENPPNDPQFVILATPAALFSSPTDPKSMFAAASASSAGFKSAFASGGSFDSISAAVPAFSAPNLANNITDPQVFRVYKWNFDVQHQFGPNTSIDVAYVGNYGTHIYWNNAGINGCNVAGFTALRACNAFTGAGVNPNFLAVNYALSNGISDYNGLTTSFTHRYTSGMVQINYTWSHALDDVSNSGVNFDAWSNTGFLATNNSITFPEDPANPKKYNYGSADYDVRQSLNLNYVWGLPIKKYITRDHGPSRLVDGWYVNGDMFLRSGFPLTLVDGGTSSALQSGGYGSAADLTYIFGNTVAPGGSGLNCRTLLGPGQPGRNNCLNPANFAPSSGNFGNVDRNTFRGPGYWGTDFSLMKHTKITERLEFAFGAQFFNVFNHANFDSPVIDIHNPAFGSVLKTVSPPTTMYGSVLGADAAPRLIQWKTQLSF